MRRAACLLAILLAAAGCSRGVDPGQARICRMLPAALEAEDATIDMLSDRPGERPRTVRVEYRSSTPERAPRQATVTCTFAGEGYAPDRLDLVAVTHDGTPLSDIQLLVLKRWYLGSLETAVGQGGGVAAAPLIAVPLPPQVAYALQLLINSVPLASLQALLALAFALVYGLFGRILFGFGEVAVIGSYGAVLGIGFAVTIGIGVPAAALPLALGTAIALGAVAGAALGSILSSVLARGRGLALVVASVGLAIAIPEALRLAQGAADRWVQTFLRDPIPLIAAPGFSVTATPMQVLVAGLAIASMLGLALVMARTPAGRAWRATAEDPGAAALFGIDLQRVSFLTFVASGALSGLAGFMLVANYGGIGFSAGLLLGLKALLAAVVGGVGSLAGAALAGALIGIVETVWSGYFPLAYKDVAVLGLLTLLLVLRPGGLLGFAERGPRPV